MHRTWALTLWLASAGIFASAASAQPYTLAATHTLGGEGGWDYLSYEPGTQRLFVTRGTHIQVVAPESGTVLADIPDTPGVHGFALAPELAKGYSSNGRDNSIGVFDLKTLKPLARIATPAGQNPDFIVYDPVSRRVFAFNGRSHDASVIDAATDTLVATIPLSGKPEAAVADGRGTVFVDIEDTAELTAIDTMRTKVASTWPLQGCVEPAGLAMDTAARRLFVGCHNRVLLVLDAADGRPVAQLPIGDGVDANAWDPSTQRIFSSQGDGTLTVIKAQAGDRYAVEQTVATRPGARTMALNTVNHEVYLVSAAFTEEPPAAGSTRPRRTLQPGSFTLLVLRPGEH